ncbi:hypothetical protein AJ80_07912 [Polytolypa hystricis UAMH7299]|uniref:Uncharacterized protein n=1 Tax=Polytolypa hystricis (strain UAMH7299) TaxID=1447883 RepID=A0A2B7XHL5_POLH7|nr:hypothetical protein AJ80_07912 [Polytolypa hystricis UAMH7299]
MASIRSRPMRLNGRFSASTVPKEAFLTVRCIWPKVKEPEDTLSYIVSQGSFFRDEHVAQGSRLFHTRCLGLSTLETLYGLICTPNIPKTPPQHSYTIADKRGPFSILVSLHRQLRDKVLHTPLDAPQPLTAAPKGKRFHDATTHPSSLTLPTPQALSATRPGDEEPVRRTPTETLVANFMVALLGGMACLVQPLNSSPLCMANSYETTFQFGPVNGTGQQQGLDLAQFRARIGRSIPFSLFRAKEHHVKPSYLRQSRLLVLSGMEISLFWLNNQRSMSPIYGNFM